MRFILRSEQPADMRGLKLKAAIIQEPITTDTVTIETGFTKYIKLLGAVLRTNCKF